MIGDRIKKLRKENNIYQKDLAKELGLKQQTISLYESNKRQPDYDTLQKIANYFNCSTDYLLGRTDQRNPGQANKKIKQALADNPELMEFWEEVSTREELLLMFKQTKDLKPSSIKRIIEIVKLIEEEEAERYGG
ncbi:helix-turn-helix domain-containing protein [Fuchsiella alkaliacetigena]|uniref:helix-turn-helix domain-containing protein n=1 Tax=Fuchsiella alkaliacetigena TaxID=957042 RepID=UPI00200B7D47|nr:helix-turn-helix transcriptional regulator [Fuchsiella alkaliacetigena]MCK8824691.1 helix-turn-helix domain-containing protein [Fuchsiella alkaliacetigena]